MFHWVDFITILGIIMQIWGFIWLLKYQNDPNTIDYLIWQNAFKNKLKNKKFIEKYRIRLPDVYDPYDLAKVPGITMIEMNIIENRTEAEKIVQRQKVPLLFYRFWKDRKRKSVQLIIIGLFLLILQIVISWIT